MSENNRIDIEEYEAKRRKRIIKILLIIILLLLIIITSFKTGQKFYEIKNTNLNSVNTKIDSSVAKWNFNVKIIY